MQVVVLAIGCAFWRFVAVVPETPPEQEAMDLAATVCAAFSKHPLIEGLLGYEDFRCGAVFPAVDLWKAFGQTHPYHIGDHICGYQISTLVELCINCAWHDPLGSLETCYDPTSDLQDPLETV